MKMMTNPELIDKLYEEISRQNTIYMSIIGTMVAVVLGIAFAYVWQQLKFSDKGIEKMKRNIYEEFKIDDIKGNVKETRKNNNKSRENIEKLQTQLDDFEVFKTESVGALLGIHAAQFSLVSSDADELLLNNELNDMNDVVDKYYNVKLERQTIMRIIADISNGLFGISKRTFSDGFKKSIKGNLKNIDEYLMDGIDDYEKSKQEEKNLRMFKEYRERVRKM